MQCERKCRLGFTTSASQSAASRGCNETRESCGKSAISSVAHSTRRVQSRQLATRPPTRQTWHVECRPGHSPAVGSWQTSHGPAPAAEATNTREPMAKANVPRPTWLRLRSQRPFRWVLFPLFPSLFPTPLLHDSSQSKRRRFAQRLGVFSGGRGRRKQLEQIRTRTAGLGLGTARVWIFFRREVEVGSMGAGREQRAGGFREREREGCRPAGGPGWLAWAGLDWTGTGPVRLSHVQYVHTFAGRLVSPTTSKPARVCTFLFFIIKRPRHVFEGDCDASDCVVLKRATGRLVICQSIAHALVQAHPSARLSLHVPKSASRRARQTITWMDLGHSPGKKHTALL